MDSHKAPGLCRTQPDIDSVLGQAQEATQLSSVDAPLGAYAGGVIDTYRWLVGETDERPEV